MAFNNQLQQTSITLGTSQGSSNVWGLTNTFSATQNNGNVASQSLTAPGLGTTIGTGYTYDGVNRLQKAMENASNPGASACSSTGGQWCRFYGYGQGGHGNAAVASSGGASGSPSPQEPASFDTSNHIADADANWQYGDGRGNVTTDRSGNTFVYDAENRQVSYCGLGSICTAYTYDGAGRRVMASNANGTTVFVYDAGGNLAAEYATAVQTTVCATCYVTTDHLGSTRVVTDDNGCAVFRQDYMPFGMAVLAGTGDPRLNAGGEPNCAVATNGYVTASPARTQFTSKERDSESGLDFFGGRYFSGAQGRFTSVDPAFESAILELPQTWNRYSYVYNRPTFATDPDGRCPICVGAIVGGVVEGGWNLGSQLYQNGGNLSSVSWGEVGASALGGAATGALAVATGGTSLVSNALAGDIAAGVASTVAGGIVTRAANGESAGEVFSPSDISIDAVAGFVGGAGGHVAADFIHVPEEPSPLGRRNHAVGRRKLAKYNAAVANRNSAMRLQAGVGVAAGSFPTHGTTGFLNNFWDIFDWLSSPPPPPPSINGAASTFTPCQAGDTTPGCN